MPPITLDTLRAASGYFWSGTASAQYSADATIGQLRFGLTGAMTAAPERRHSVWVSGTIALTEALHIIFVTTSGDVTATPVTVQFLSNPAHGPSPVPVPAF